ncbi:MAG: hypothetical protein Alis3KO_30540 [Aliiglaciecola sp.]
MLLKQKINLFILLTAFLAASFAYLTSIWILDNFLANNFIEQKDASVNSIKRDIEVFDRILLLVEERWDRELSVSLPAIARQLQESTDKTPTQVKQHLLQLKQAHNLSDIHLINEQLIVYQSTFDKEIGLDLKNVSEDYTRLLQNVLTNNTFSAHRVSPSTVTGDIKKYAYYSLEGSNFIVNADIDVKSRLESGNNNEVADYLFGDYVAKLSDKYQWITNVDLFLVSGADQWSLFNQGKKIDMALARKLFKGEADYSEMENTLLIPVFMQSYDELGFKAFLQINFDDSLLYKTKFNLQISALIVALLIALFSVLILRFGARKALTERFYDLMEQIKEKQPHQNKYIVLEGNDELVQLSNAINEMMLSLDKEQDINKELVGISQRDGLTNLGNRRSFDEHLSLEWKQAKRLQNDMSIIMLDVDYFKDYNDFYGHVAGDECLVKIAECLSKQVSRPTDFVARYGGEEFICILPNTDASGALKISEDVRLGVESLAIMHEKSLAAPVVTVSAGCFTINGNYDIGETEIIKSVDHLLYQAKDRGRNCVVEQSFTTVRNVTEKS